jgi:hypothetical protein
MQEGLVFARQDRAVMASLLRRCCLCTKAQRLRCWPRVASGEMTW